VMLNPLTPDRCYRDDAYNLTVLVNFLCTIFFDTADK